MKYFVLFALLPFLAHAGDKHDKSAQKQEQSQSQSVDQANSQSVSFEDRKQAPAVFAPSIAPTAPCYYSASGGLSLPGIGASGGKAIKDKECEKREEARLWYSMGFVDAAVALMCKDSPVPNCPYPNGKPLPVVAECPAKAERVLEKCVSK